MKLWKTILETLTPAQRKNPEMIRERHRHPIADRAGCVSVCIHSVSVARDDAEVYSFRVALQHGIGCARLSCGKWNRLHAVVMWEARLRYCLCMEACLRRNILFNVRVLFYSSPCEDPGSLCRVCQCRA